VHRDHQRIAGGGTDILALQRDRRRQYDIGMPRARRPCRLVDDDRIGARKGTAQPVQVLVVVKRVTARPVDQTDVGVNEPMAIIVEGFARVQQHIGKPRHRDEIADAVSALRQGGDRHRHGRLPGVRGGS